MEHFLKEIEITNFKSIRHQKIEGCKRINLFLGYPNVGKSNILEAIGSAGMFNLSTDASSNLILSDWIRYYGFASIFYEGKKGAEASIILNDNKEYVFYFGENANGQYVAFSEKMDSALVDYILFNGKEVRRSKSSSKSEIEIDLTDILEPIKENSLNHIKPYKGFNAHNISQKGSFSLLFPKGDNLVEIIASNHYVRAELREHLKKGNYRLLIDVASGQIKIIQDNEDGIAYFIDYSLIADTLQRLIFYKAAIASNKNAVLIFEEPEAHMFPPYIKSLMWDVVQSDTNQFFIATHSPFVLDTLLEEGGDEVMIYLVDFKDGETVIRSMTCEELEEVKKYGIDLFFNMEGYLKDGQ